MIVAADSTEGTPFGAPPGTDRVTGACSVGTSVGGTGDRTSPTLAAT